MYNDEVTVRLVCGCGQTIRTNQAHAFGEALVVGAVCKNCGSFTTNAKSFYPVFQLSEIEHFDVEKNMTPAEKEITSMMLNLAQERGMQNPRVVELYAENARISRLLASKDWTVVAMDPLKEHIAQLLTKGVDARLGTVEDFLSDEFGEHFDFVVICESVVRIEGIFDVLKRLLQKCPRAVIMCSAPSLDRNALFPPNGAIDYAVRGVKFVPSFELLKKSLGTIGIAKLKVVSHDGHQFLKIPFVGRLIASYFNNKKLLIYSLVWSIEND